MSTNYMKLSDVREGDIVELTGFTCIREHDLRRVYKDSHNGDFFIDCDEGRHDLDGQLLNDEHVCVGVTLYSRKDEEATEVEVVPLFVNGDNLNSPKYVHLIELKEGDWIMAVLSVGIPLHVHYKVHRHEDGWFFIETHGRYGLLNLIRYDGRGDLLYGIVKVLNKEKDDILVDADEIAGITKSPSDNSHKYVKMSELKPGDFVKAVSAEGVPYNCVYEVEMTEGNLSIYPFHVALDLKKFLNESLFEDLGDDTLYGLIKVDKE